MTTIGISKADVEKYLANDMLFVKEWIMTNVAKEVLESWLQEKYSKQSPLVRAPSDASRGVGVRQPGSYGGRSQTAGVTKGSEGVGANTVNLFEQFVRGTNKRAAQPRKTRNELLKMNQSDLFMELIRDVANELDVDVLCHKILMNVSVLTRGDRGSMFLTRGTKENKYLVSKLFDVTETSQLEDTLHTEENHITVPFGKGIAGTVALTKQPINIVDAYLVG